MTDEEQKAFNELVEIKFNILKDIIATEMNTISKLKYLCFWDDAERDLGGLLIKDGERVTELGQWYEKYSHLPDVNWVDGHMTI